MAFLKKLFGSSGELGELEKARADAFGKLADAMLDLHIGLMQTHDPVLKKEDLDLKSLRSLVLGAEIAQAELDDSAVLEIGAKGLANKAWPARFVGLEILKGLGIRLAERKESPSPYTAAGRNPVALGTVVQKISVALSDQDPKIRDAAKSALSVIEFNKKLRGR